MEKLGCKVTYIFHSSFFVEWEDCCFLFDYYKGMLPEPMDKPLIVFSSHSHADHFTPAVFDYGKRWKDVHYVLSDEIDLTDVGNRPDEALVTMLGPDEELSLSPDVVVSTLKSTDLGVAFFIRHDRKTLYHAGDLHWWLWDECTEEENAEMTEMFRRELDKCPKVHIDLAFLPLDPRQEDYFWQGMDAYFRSWDIDRAFPMHFGNVYSIAQRIMKREESLPYRDRIIPIERKNREFEL